MDIMFFLLSLGYLILAFLNKGYALNILPFFFISYFLKIHIAGVPFTLIEVFIYILFFVYFLSSVKEVFLFRKQQKILFFLKNNWYVFFPVSLFLVGTIAALFIVPLQMKLPDGTIFYAYQTALGIFKGWIINPLLFFLILVMSVKENRQFIFLFHSYVFSALFLSLYALFQVISNQYITPDHRASGPFESANYLALYIAPAVLYALIRFQETGSLFFHRKIQKIQFLYWTLVFFILLFSLFFTKSYAAFFAVFFSAIIYFTIRYRKTVHVYFKRKVFFIGILSALVFLFFSFFIDPHKFQNVWQIQNRNSTSVRIEVYTIAWHLIQEHWFYGIGPGQFQPYYALEAPRILGHAPYEWSMLHPHNLYFAVWLNIGFLGLFGFLWLLVVCFRKFFLYLHFYDADKVPFPLISFSLLCIILIHGLMDTPFFKNDLSLLFWLIVGSILLPLDSHRKDILKHCSTKTQECGDFIP